jgi:hypothetical protein
MLLSQLYCNLANKLSQKVKVKVNSSLYLIKHRAIKAHKEVEV